MSGDVALPGIPSKLMEVAFDQIILKAPTIMGV